MDRTGRLKFNFDDWYERFVGLDLTRMYALFLVCVGFTEKSIARAMGRSTRTINRYIRQAMVTLGAKTKGEAFYIAGQRGIWDDWDPLSKDLMSAVGAGEFRSKVKPSSNRGRINKAQDKSL